MRRRFLLLIILLWFIAAGAAYSQESIEPGRKPRREHFHVDTVDEVPTSVEHLRRFEVEVAGGRNYAQTPENALVGDEVRDRKPYIGYSALAKLSYYFSHKLSIGISGEVDNLGYYYNSGATGHDPYPADFAAPMYSFGILGRYTFRRIYVGASIGYIHIPEYKTPADYSIGIGVPVKGPSPGGFTPGLQLGYKQRLFHSHALSIFIEAGGKGVMTDVCKDWYYTGMIGLSYKFKDKLIFHED